MWTPELPAEFDRAGRAAARAAECHHERSIAVLDVLVRALVVSATRELAERITERDHAVFGTPPGRAPSATGNPNTQRRIESGAIDPGLTAGDYPARPLR
jgi:hypothetical protein